MRHRHRHLIPQAMLYSAVAFFLIAMIAAMLGFGGVAVGAVNIAKVLFVAFALISVAGFFIGVIREPQVGD